MRPCIWLSGVSATSTTTLTGLPPLGVSVTVGRDSRQEAASTRTMSSPRTVGCKAITRGLPKRLADLGGIMVTAVVFSVCLIAALGVFFYQIWQRFNLLRAAAPVALFDRIPERIRALLVYFFGQKKFVRPEASIVREQTAGWMHFFIFWGFTLLALQIATMCGRAYSESFYLPLFSPGLLGGPYLLIRDVMEVAVLLSIGVALAR